MNLNHFLNKRIHLNLPQDLIPNTSPWYWGWGIQGIRTILYFLYIDLFTKRDLERDNETLDKYLETLEQYKFSCEFGKKGDKHFRAYIQNLEASGVAPRKQLRTLVRFNEFRQDSKGSYHLKRSKVVLTAGITLLALYLFIFVYFFSLFSLAPISMVYKAFLLCSTSTLFVLPFINLYRMSIFTYIESLRLHNKIDSMRPPNDHLRLVK